MIYHITSTSWTGYIEVEYNELGYLVSHNSRNADLTEKQQQWFLNKLPRELAELQRLLDGSTAVITEVKQDITFATFWKAYRPERNDTHRARAEKKWNTLTKEEQVKAFNYIPKYDRNRPEWQSKLFAISYLRDRCWE